MVGEFARRNLELLFVDRLFLGVGAIDSQAGLTEYNVEDAMIKPTMIRNAKEVILVVDSSKFEKIALAFVAPFNVLHHLITNEEPPRDLLSVLKENKVCVHVIEESGARVI
jgi:DeoR/GlpR family transcriptional regulator of sugar metabolism